MLTIESSFANKEDIEISLNAKVDGSIPADSVVFGASSGLVTDYLLLSGQLQIMRCITQSNK